MAHRYGSQARAGDPPKVLPLRHLSTCLAQCECPSGVTPLLVWSYLLQYTRAARKHLDPAAKGNICAQVFWPGLTVGGGVDL